MTWSIIKFSGDWSSNYLNLQILVVVAQGWELTCPQILTNQPLKNCACEAPYKLLFFMNVGLVGFGKHILAQGKTIQLVCLLPFKVIKTKSASDSIISTFY